MNKGVFCISIDFELLWGRKDLDYSKFIEKTKKERSVIKKLLNLFKKYNVSVTWATVGKLYESGDKLWSGKDIIDSIKKDKIHELASHSYSHEDFSKIPKTQAAKEYHFPKGVSFVFPRNKIAHLDLLKGNGFKNYRGKDMSEFELLLPRIPATGLPKLSRGLIEIPSSMYFVSARGIKKFIPQGLRLLKCKLGINRAVKQKQIFHIWFHPVDFVDNSKGLIKEFEEILKYASKMRSEDLLEIKTMKQISEAI